MKLTTGEEIKDFSFEQTKLKSEKAGRLADLPDGTGAVLVAEALEGVGSKQHGIQHDATGPGIRQFTAVGATDQHLGSCIWSLS